MRDRAPARGRARRRPVTAASRSTDAVDPSTAAACTSANASASSSAMREARTPVGRSDASAGSSMAASVITSCWSSASARACTINGLPRAALIASLKRGPIDPPTRRLARSSDSSVESGARALRGRSAVVWTTNRCSSVPGAGGRLVRMRPSGEVAMRSSTRRRKRKVPPSAQCRSSMTSTVGAARHSASSASSSRSATANSAVEPAPASSKAREPAGSPPGGSSPCGAFPRASWIAPNGRSIAKPCAAPLRMRSVADVSNPGPEITSPISRDLPLPASPTTSTAEPRPTAAAFDDSAQLTQLVGAPDKLRLPATPPGHRWTVSAGGRGVRSVRARTTLPHRRGLIGMWTPTCRAAATDWALTSVRRSPLRRCFAMAMPRSCS